MKPPRLLLRTVALALLAACKSGSPPESSTIISVQVTPSTWSLKPGDQKQLSAKVLGPAGISQGVIWRSQNTQVLTVTSTGLITAIIDGQTSIRAMWADDTLEWGSSEVIVTTTPISDAQPAGGVLTVKKRP